MYNLICRNFRADKFSRTSSARKLDLNIFALNTFQKPSMDTMIRLNKAARLSGRENNSLISRFTLRSIASLITISSQYILTLASTMEGRNQNNTSER